MTKEEIDILWQKAMQESIKYGEMFTRYHFAKLVEEAEREACAKLCDYVYDNIVTDEHINDIAYKIRARGQA
jgi:hypothetical protein